MTRTLLPLLLMAALGGCGAEGEPAPEVDASVIDKPCESVDEQLSLTREQLDLGAANNLRAALVELEAQRGDAADGLLTGLLAIVAELWANGLRDNPEVVSDLDRVLVDMGPLIGAVLRFLAEDGVVQADSREMVAELLVTCPDGSMTALLAALLERPELLEAFGNALADPLIRDIIGALPDEAGGGDNAGFVALVRTVARAIQSESFVFSDLVAILDPFFDTTQPPIGPLVDELNLLLSGPRLADLQLLSACLDQDIRVSSGATGIDALGALLYAMITDPDVRLGERLDDLESTLQLLADPAIQQMINAVVDRLATDAAVRDGMKPGIRFLMTSPLAPGALADLANLLDAGIASEFIGLISNIATHCQRGAQ